MSQRHSQVEHTRFAFQWTEITNGWPCRFIRSGTFVQSDCSVDARRTPTRLYVLAMVSASQPTKPTKPPDTPKTRKSEKSKGKKTHWQMRTLAADS
jgi:hypothetical protein